MRGVFFFFFFLSLFFFYKCFRAGLKYEMMIRKKQNKHFSKKEVGIFMLNLSPVQKSLLFGHQKLDILPSFSPPSLCHLFTSFSSFLLSSSPPLPTPPS